MGINSMNETMQTPGMVYDSAQQYACTDCPARCCRFPWHIDVTQEEVDRCKSIPWIAERLAAHNLDFVEQEKGSYGMPRAQLKDGGYGCVFLDEDNRCSIHKAEGHTLLPKTCRNYPFRFVENPAQNSSETAVVFPVVSPFCTSILHNFGEALGNVVVAKYTDQKAEGVVMSLPDSIVFCGATMPKAVYLQLADWLASLFETERFSVAEALWRGRMALSVLLTSNPAQEPINNDLLEQAIAEAMNQPAWDSGAAIQGSRMSSQVLVAITLFPMLLVSELDAYRNTSNKRTWRVRLKQAGLILQLLFDKGTVSLWGTPNPVDFKAAKAVKMDECTPEMQAEIRRYFYNVFLNKQLLVSDQDFLRTYFSYGIMYAVILRLSRYVAYANGRTQVSLDDLKEGIGYATLTEGHKSRIQKTGLSEVSRLIFENLAYFAQTFQRLLVCESTQGE